MRIPARFGPLLSGAAMLAGLAACAAATGTPNARGEAESTSVEAMRGRTFVETHCASCHQIDRSGASPLAEAPPFRDLHRRYPVEALEEGLAEGLTTAHPEMPVVAMEEDQVREVIAWLKTLQDHR